MQERKFLCIEMESDACLLVEVVLEVHPPVLPSSTPIKHSVSTVFPTLPIRFKKSIVFCGDALLVLLLPEAATEIIDLRFVVVSHENLHALTNATGCRRC